MAGPSRPTDLPAVSISDERLIKEKGFQVIRPLGEGSYAKVYLTKKGEKAWSSACKVINTRRAPSTFVLKFLPREIDILTKVVHPNIIEVFSIYSKSDKYLIFMRYGEYGDLLDYVLEKGELQEPLAKVWTYQLSLALQYLHAMQVAHRDIKCENILITQNFNVKLADFGFARFVTDSSGRPTTSSTYCGSLAYASPEILKGRPYYPKCSDVWSLGIVVYIMLNKCMPFNDGNIKALYKQQQGKHWRIRTKILPRITQNAVEFVKKLLEPDYRKRVNIGQVVNDPWFVDSGLTMNEEEKKAITNLNVPAAAETPISKESSKDPQQDWPSSISNSNDKTDTLQTVSSEKEHENFKNIDYNMNREIKVESSN